MTSDKMNYKTGGGNSITVQSLIDYAKQIPSGNGDRTIGTTWTYSPGQGWNYDDRAIYYAWNVPPILFNKERQNIANIADNHAMLHSFFAKIQEGQYAKYTYSKLNSELTTRETFYLHAWGSQYKTVFDSYLLDLLHPWEYPQSVGYDVTAGEITGVKLYSSVTPAGLQQQFPNFIRKNISIEGINPLLAYGKYALVVRRFDAQRRQIGWKIEINLIKNAEALWKASAEVLGVKEGAIFLEDGYGSSSNAFAYDIRDSGKVHKLTVYRVCANFS
jgi:hypothetical protein